MKAKTLLCYLMVVCLGGPLFGQSTENQMQFKIYTNLESSNFRITNGNDTLITEDKGNRILFSGFSPAIVWQKENGNFREMDLSNLVFEREDEAFIVNNVSTGTSEPVRGFRSTNIGFALGYELNWALIKEPDIFRPYIGLSNQVIFDFEDFIPKTSAGFPLHTFHLSNRISVLPRAIFDASEKLFVDMNIRIPLVNLSYDRNREENPLLPSEEQTTNEVNLNFLPKTFQFRIGMGLKF